MKAISLFRHFGAGILFCSLMTFAAVAFAEEPINGGTNGKSDASAKEVVGPVQQEPAATKKKTEVTVVAKDPVAPTKPAAKTELKKEEVSNSSFSFSFLYYLFYKGNFAENTNKALVSSWNVLIQRLLE